MSIAQEYIDGLKNAYDAIGEKEQWEDFAQTVHGASKEAIEKLKAHYPDVPNSLLQLLEFVDGTYWREYDKKTITFYFLGSDIEEYPYYLLSAEQMCDVKDLDWLPELVDRASDFAEIDEKIIDNSAQMCWLHFSDCMNNGGTSKLFIDFSPSAKGVKGQIVRYLHDPDEIMVIADSFDAYLQMLIDNAYDFITEDMVGEA